MNKEEFIPNIEALALRKLGFNQPCLGYYNKQGEFRLIMLDKNTPGLTVAPTYRAALKFFRDEYSFDGWVVPIHCLEGKLYTYIIESPKNTPDALYGFDFDDFTSWEDSELALIKKLIEFAAINNKQQQ